ncbi:probable E3 ubiquitin-protein ligase ZFP1 isoform X2 [Cornus florida]|uniref:probable E3 ubiquitin-protein ligase ZFP1 isoform X2 n=1 Tax=Cornus florida TaxID=4283 RepID=UPI00289F3ACE|nr:probable E3 ubiquitin-protein ligase ZFP1 isoform X2 [Cornus florida]
MEHRHFSNSFNMSEMDQGRAVAPETGSYVYPVGNMLRGEVHCASRGNSDSRANESSSSSFSREVPQFQPTFSGPVYDSFPLSPAAGNLYRAPENNAGHAHSSYNNRHPIHGFEGSLLDPVTGTGRRALKRKSPGISMAFEGGSTSRFYDVGSSSGSSELLQEIPTLDHQRILPGPIGLPQYRGTSLSIAGEESLRNVRSRTRLDLEANHVRSHVSSYSSHHYHSTTQLTNISGMADLTNINPDERTHEWNFIPVSHAAHGRISTSETNGFSRATNQFLVGGSTAETGCYYHDSVSGGNPVLSSQYLHGPHIQSAREDHTYYPQRATPSYRTGPSYPCLGHETASSENGLQSLSEVYPSRHSGPSSARIWHNSYINERSRIVTERFQSFPRVADAYGRMGPEALMMVDHPSFYAGFRDLFDQHRDMRLDIDSMSFEELLALGERIGNVNTGLSEDMIFKCLTEIMYCSSDDKPQEGTCVICLEEYKKEEEVGIIKNCGHNYHVGCIRKWLSMKNVCPICKAPALADCPTEE